MILDPERHPAATAAVPCGRSRKWRRPMIREHRPEAVGARARPVTALRPRRRVTQHLLLRHPTIRSVPAVDQRLKRGRVPRWTGTAVRRTCVERSRKRRRLLRLHAVPGGLHLERRAQHDWGRQ